MAFEGLWIEIPAKDIARAVSFYSAVFETSAEISDEGVRRVANFNPPEGGTGVGATLNETTNFEPSDHGPLVYVNAGSALDAMLARVTAAGGRVVIPRTETGPGRFYATFADSEGNVLALFGS